MMWMALSSRTWPPTEKNESFKQGFYRYYKETKRLKKFEKKCGFLTEKKKQKPKIEKDWGLQLSENNKISGEVKTAEV